MLKKVNIYIILALPTNMVLIVLCVAVYEERRSCRLCLSPFFDILVALEVHLWLDLFANVHKQRQDKEHWRIWNMGMLTQNNGEHAGQTQNNGRWPSLIKKNGSPISSNTHKVEIQDSSDYERDFSPTWWQAWLWHKPLSLPPMASIYGLYCSKKVLTSKSIPC